MTYNPTSPITENYINTLTLQHSQEKQTLLSTINSYKQQLISSKEYLHTLINTYEDKLKDLTNQHQQTISQLKQQHEAELHEKDTQILKLISQNETLTNYNETLLSKIDSYIAQLNQSQSSFTSKLNALQHKNNDLAYQNKQLHLHYNNKLDNCYRAFNDEKNYLYYNFGASIKDINDTYAISKTSYQHIINTQTTNHNNQVNALLNENKQLTDVHYDNMKQMQQLITDNKSLTKRNKQLEFDITNCGNFLKGWEKQTTLLVS